VGKDRVQRLMRLHGIKARGKRKFVVTTDSRHDLPVAENLLARDFTPAAPNQVWSSDITYIATDEGWLYLVCVIDLFSRLVVGWSMQAHMQTSLVTDALRTAWFRRQPAPGLIFHSDRGSQYCAHSFQAALARFGMQSSMSRKGNCWDNAPTESLWGSLKVGRLYGKKFATQRQAMDEIIDWLTFYNHRRLDEPLEGLAPIIVQELLAIIAEMVREGRMAVILVEQHAHQILPITQQALVLERGHVVHQGPSDVLAADPSLLDRWLGVAAH